jgi:hypothetical protein
MKRTRRDKDNRRFDSSHCKTRTKAAANYRIGVPYGIAALTA